MNIILIIAKLLVFQWTFQTDIKMYICNRLKIARSIRDDHFYSIATLVTDKLWTR